MTIDQDAITAIIDALDHIRPQRTDGLACYGSVQVQPIGAERYDSRFNPDGSLSLTIRLLEWDQDAANAATLRGIKEQRVAALPAASLLDAARFAAFARAWASALSPALASYLVLQALPCDLFFPKVLQLKRPQTEAQFIAALSVKSRLGRFL
jgi:hypothetical protein